MRRSGGAVAVFAAKEVSFSRTVLESNAAEGGLGGAVAYVPRSGPELLRQCVSGQVVRLGGAGTTLRQGTSPSSLQGPACPSSRSTVRGRSAPFQAAPPSSYLAASPPHTQAPSS